MNDSCTPLLMDAQPAKERSLLPSFLEKFVPDSSEQDLEICRNRAKTPLAQLVEYGNVLTGSAEHTMML